MILIGDISTFTKKITPITIDSQQLLVIFRNKKFHLIENKCGHFGLALEGAKFSNNEIICPQHGISFDLDSGEAINRPYENCDPITIYKTEIKNNQLFKV